MEMDFTGLAVPFKGASASSFCEVVVEPLGYGCAEFAVQTADGFVLALHQLSRINSAMLAFSSSAAAPSPRQAPVAAFRNGSSTGAHHHSDSADGTHKRRRPHQHSQGSSPGAPVAGLLPSKSSTQICHASLKELKRVLGLQEAGLRMSGTIHMWMRIVILRQPASGRGSHSAGKRRRSRELWSHLKLAGEKLEEFPRHKWNLSLAASLRCKLSLSVKNAHGRVSHAGIGGWIMILSQNDGEDY